MAKILKFPKGRKRKKVKVKCVGYKHKYWHSEEFLIVFTWISYGLLLLALLCLTLFMIHKMGLI